MKIERNKRSTDIFCEHNMPQKLFFFCLILLVLCCTEGLYERKLLECAVGILFLLKGLYYGLWKTNWYRHATCICLFLQIQWRLVYFVNIWDNPHNDLSGFHHPGVPHSTARAQTDPYVSLPQTHSAGSLLIILHLSLKQATSTGYLTGLVVLTYEKSA